MNVLFLEIDTSRQWALASVGPACLAAYVRRMGHGADLFRVPVDASVDRVLETVRDAGPDLLALSLTTRQWLRARDLVAALRREIDLPVVTGGLHPTFSPGQVLEAEGFDAVCLGEGEEAFADLLEALGAGSSMDGLPDIPNLQLPGRPRSPLRPPVAELDSLPFLARDFLDEPPGVAHVATQRGCPFPCTYCAARSYDQLYQDVARYGRRRSHESVLTELHLLADGGKLSYVVFLDDTFTLNRRWVEEFCDRYGEELGRPFSLHARAETVDADLLERLARAGCFHVTYGVESGSERIRRHVMRRPVTNQRLREVFRWTREAGIRVTANYMLGLPEETTDDLEATFALHDQLDPDDFGYFVFYPYPGTRLFQVCRERGYLPEDWMHRPANHRETILNLPDLTREDVARAYDRFTSVRERDWRRRSSEADTRHVWDAARTG